MSSSSSSTSSPRWRRINDLRIVGASGTNKVMAGELSRLARRAIGGVRLSEPQKMGTGALMYPFDPALARVVVTYQRTCTRAFWDLIVTDAERLEPLYDDLMQALAVDLTPWVWDDARISVEAHDVRSFAAGERQVVGTVKNAWVDAAARQGLRLHVDAQHPDVVIAVRCDDGVTRISIDLCGRAMNQRGYRQPQALAPLREDTAAVLLMLARFDPKRQVLIDPMAGSGTLAIEAACMADARPLWVAPRAPLAPRLPALRAHFAEPAPPLFADTRAHVFASDRDRAAIDWTRQAMVATQTTASITTAVSDFRDLTPARIERACRLPDDRTWDALIVSNPPYGERLDDPNLLGLYRDLGQWCRQFRGQQAAFLVANPDFERAFGVPPRVKKPLRNGPLRAYFYLYDL